MSQSLDSMKGLPAGQRASTGDVFHPTAVGNETLFSQHVIKVSGIELGEAILLGNMDLKVGTTTSQYKLTTGVITGQKA